MDLQLDHQRRLRGYLLGDLSLEEQRLLEEGLFADDNSFEQLLFVEEDLIDDYLRGELSAHERARFENHFLAAPERQQDLRFAKVLRKYAATAAASKQSPHSSSWLVRLSTFFASLVKQKPAIAFSFALTLALLVVGGFWLVRRTQEEERASLQPQPSETQSPPSEIVQKPTGPDGRTTNVNQVENHNQADLPAEVPVTNRPQNSNAPTNSGQPKPSVFKVILASGLVRGDGGAKRVKIPRSATTVRLEIEVDPAAGDYQNYSVVLQTASGEKILSRSGLRARAAPGGKIVIWEIPARLLKREDYYLKLSGRNAAGQFESAGAYDFRVIE
jgi:hypothetical protein